MAQVGRMPWHSAKQLGDGVICLAEAVEKVKHHKSLDDKPLDGKPLDVVGIGNAIVDITSRESEEFIRTHKLNKTNMTLIDETRSDFLRSHLTQSNQTPGGSAANTTVGVADLGGKVGFIGKVSEDPLGLAFMQSIREAGVSFNVPPADDGPATARCVIIVTPDALRTMNTYLGVSAYLYPKDIDPQLVASAQVLYCEGYIWDVPITKQAIRQAIGTAKAAGTKVSFTLSDTRCVERHLDEWKGLLDDSIDILFGSEEELAVLTGANSLEESLDEVRQCCEVVCATRGREGSVVATPADIFEIAPFEVSQRVDTTGAGDMYAAGFLYGYTSGLDLVACGKLASLVAGQIIMHEGARSERDLGEIVEQELGIVCGERQARVLEGVSGV